MLSFRFYFTRYFYVFFDDRYNAFFFAMYYNSLFVNKEFRSFENITFNFLILLFIILPN